MQREYLDSEAETNESLTVMATSNEDGALLEAILGLSVDPAPRP
jgi:hypothetical protein